MPSNIIFFTFGMFIIDTIEILSQPNTPSNPAKHNLPGGAGLYALLGARLLSSSPHSSDRTQMILDAGSDSPRTIADELESWGTATVIRRDASRLTTRAWNGYRDREVRLFKYVTPKRRVGVDDLATEVVRGVKGWHLVCGAVRCEEVVRGLRERGGSGWVVWEPVPDLCGPGERGGVRRVVELMGTGVISPNKEELGMFFENGEAEVGRLLGWDEGCGLGMACVVREGTEGSVVHFPPGEAERGRRKKIRLNAYHDRGRAGEVVDTTGGGNTYLGAGALAMAYACPLIARSEIAGLRKGENDTSLDAPVDEGEVNVDDIPPPVRRVYEYINTFVSSRSLSITRHERGLLVAAICACVAAGFAIEQYGVPSVRNEMDEDRNIVSDLWNESSVEDRIEKYLTREGKGIEAQVLAWDRI